MRFLKLLLVLMGVLASDNFNRANENPLGNGVWSTASGNVAMRVVSNQATPTDLTTTDDFSYYSGISWPADQFSRAKLTVSSTAGGNRGATVVVRQASAANTHYRLTADHAASNNVVVAKVVAGTFTALTGFPVTQAWTDGDTWELRVQASTLKAFLNGVQIGPAAVDTAIASGSPGIGVSVDVTSAAVDDWEGGTPDLAGPIPVVDKPLTLLRCRSLGCGNPLREVKYYETPPAVLGVTVVPDVGSLQLDGFAPALGLPITLSPEVGDLTLIGFAAKFPTTIVAGSGVLTLDGFSPAVGLPRTIVPGFGQLTLAGSAATFPRTIVPATGALSLSGFAPTFARTILPGSGALTLAGNAPTFSFVSGGFTAQPGFGALALTGLGPTIGLPRTLLPGSGSLALSGNAPAIGLPITVRPLTGLLTLTGFGPSVSFIPPGIFITPGTGQLTLVGYAPFIGTFTFRFQGGPVMTATISAGGVLTASLLGGPVFTGSMSGGPV